MSTVAIIHRLWLRRWLVAVAALVAVIAGLGIGYRIFSVPPSLQSKKYDVGTATVRVLVDTPTSQIVAVNPSGLELVTQRANLLATLMVDGVIKTAIAQRAGIAPGALHGIDESDPSPTPSAAPSARGYLISTMVLKSNDVTDPAGDQLPIIQIGTQAPDVAGATKLADAVVAGIQDYLESQATSEGLSPDRRIRVTSLGAPQAAESTRGPRNLMVFGVTFVVFALGCALIVLIPKLRKEWGRASAGELDVQERDERRPMPREPYAVPQEGYATAYEAHAVPEGIYPLHRHASATPDEPGGDDDVADLRSFSAVLRAVRSGMRESGS